MNIAVDNILLQPGRFFLIAGPCVIEEEALTFDIAARVREITAALDIPFIFKASFDKANRSSVHSFRGPGLERGLRILARIKKELGVPVISDIHESGQAAAAAEVLSILQIPAFLCRQTDLLQAAARTGKPLNIKKGQFMSPEEMGHAVNKVRECGNEQVMLTERGTFFGYNNLVVDFRGISVMKSFGVPVIIDATHSVQRPGAAGDSSGGEPQHIPLMARLGLAAGADGVFLEVHPQPEKALSDGRNSLHLERLPGLLIRLKKVYNVTNEHD